MDVKVLGSGCANCKALESRVREVLDAQGIDTPIEKVTDFGEIASWGVMSTPALVIDDRVAFTGRLPTIEELRTALTGAPG
ncbi:MAG: thioredoxin family protein [Acidimicrobiia bacterium]